MIDRLDNDAQRLAIPMIARRLSKSGYRKQESAKGEKTESDRRRFGKNRRGLEKKEPAAGQG